MKAPQDAQLLTGAIARGVCKMKNLILILLVALLLTNCLTALEAKSKSFTIKVSCTVPARLEMASPSGLDNTASTLQREPTFATSKIQTQETKYINGQKTILYTIVER
jgi:hypothetical protein